jgi:hypothetical protein
MVILCRDCLRFRQHIELLRNRISELELRLEGARQRERQLSAAGASAEPPSAASCSVGE